MFSPYSVNKLQRTPLPALTFPAPLLPTCALSPMQPFSTADVSFCRQREALQGPGFKQSDPFPPYSSGAHGVKTRSKTWKCKLLFQQKNENKGTLDEKSLAEFGFWLRSISPSVNCPSVPSCMFLSKHSPAADEHGQETRQWIKTDQLRHSYTLRKTQRSILNNIPLKL